MCIYEARANDFISTIDDLDVASCLDVGMNLGDSSTTDKNACLCRDDMVVRIVDEDDSVPQ